MNLTFILIVLILLKAFGYLKFIAWWVILLPFIFVYGILLFFLGFGFLAIIIALATGGKIIVTKKDGK